MNDLTKKQSIKETETVPQKVGTEVSDGVIADTAGGREILDATDYKGNIVFDITSAKYYYMPVYLLRKYYDNKQIDPAEKELIGKILLEKEREDNGKI